MAEDDDDNEDNEDEEDDEEDDEDANESRCDNQNGPSEPPCFESTLNDDGNDNGAGMATD